MLEQGHCLRSHILQNNKIENQHISNFSCTSISTLVAMVDTDIGVIKVTQIAGILIRRIVSYVKPESFVRKGDRIGLIHFGSRVDINFDSAGMELKVKEGDKILAGRTLATFTPMSSLPVSKQILEGPKRLLSKLASSSIGGD